MFAFSEFKKQRGPSARCKKGVTCTVAGYNGNQVTLYGGMVYRSIGYIAYQNRNVFRPGTSSYNYVWEIIHHVYGSQYDER